MTVLGGAGQGLLGALSAGVFSLILWWLGRRGSSEQIRTAWQAQAEKLRNELRRAYETQIEYLQGQLAAKDREDERKSAEIRRLNKLLNKRGDND